MTNMQDTSYPAAEIGALEASALQALQSGREDDAARHLSRIVALDPRHVRALGALGQQAYRRGDAMTARDFFRRIVDADGSNPQQWTQLAIVCRGLGDEAAEEDAIAHALEVDPRNLPALILRGNLHERGGRMHHASHAYAAVAAVASTMPLVPPDLQPAVAAAARFAENYNREKGRFLDEFLDRHYQEFAGEKLDRFRTSVDILAGRKKRYDSQSVLYHFPQLAPIEFFDRDLFPWIESLEAAFDAVRDEFLAVLRKDSGFEPYIAYPDGVPVNQFAELNHSPRWSAFHLINFGRRVDANAAQCPRTMEVLAQMPQPEEPGRTPSAMFSLLKPRTTIPPHTGVTNVRLVTHLALIIPDGCTFRVGNTVRPWIPGKAWVFDDTIEHEARNDSDHLRVILMFDIWHPHLTPPERALITALWSGINAFEAGPGHA